MANRYWVGASGDWSDSSHWSATSGGAGGASVPGLNDAVIFNANSATSDIDVLWNGNYAISSFTSVSFPYKITTGLSAGTNYYVSLSASTSMRLHNVSSSINYYLTVSGNNFNTPMSVYQTGTTNGNVQLGNSISLQTDFVGKGISHEAGDFYSNSKTIIISGTISSTGSGSWIFDISNSSVTTSHLQISNTNINFKAQDSFVTVNAIRSTTLKLQNRVFNDFFINIGTGTSDPLTISITGSPTFRLLDIRSANSAAHTVRFESAKIVTIIDELDVNPSLPNQIALNSSTPGTRFLLRKTSGIVNVSNVVIKDSSAYGGATWNANTSTDGGNNAGWNFIGPVSPVANFNQSTTYGGRPLTVNFTDTSTGPADSWLWNFGDGNTSTLQNPSKTYTSKGIYTVSLKATNTVGTNTITKTNLIQSVDSFSRTISGTFNLAGGTTSNKVSVVTISGEFKIGGGNNANQTIHNKSISGTFVLGGTIQTIVLRDTQAIEEKRYLYKVYDEDGTYIETWSDVTDNPEFTTEINELGSTMTVILARNSDSLGTSTAPLQTEAGTTITTEAGQDILVSTQSRNQVGPGSSVLHNNRVDVYVFYGEISPLLTEAGEEITTEDGEVILASMGAPNGRRIFTGFISEINSRYGNTETTIVQLSSYGFDLNQFVLDDTDGKTTVTFNSTDPSVMAQMALDRFATVSSPFNTYTRRTPTSIALSGTSVSYTFRVNTFGDVMKKILELLPPNWYFYVGLGDNTVYFRQRAATPQHLFYLGKHIKALDLKSSIIDVKNDTYFTGGGEPALFKRYTEAPAARTRRGLSLYSDSRVTLEASADVISEGIIDENNKVQYRSTVEVLAKVYDIESINVGDVIGFRNFGNFVDGLTMQVMGYNYTPDSVTIALQTLPPTISKRLTELRQQQLISENQNVPDAPTT